MRSMSILVSINCTTYNHEKYIKDSIEGFLMQKTNFTYEILIGEDCSTDQTKQIVEEYVEKYPNLIRMITSEQNVGARLNSQRLIEASKGKYIAECEGDDYWIDPYKLQKQVDYMESNEDCTFCFHNANIIKANKKIEQQSKSMLLSQRKDRFGEEKENFSAGELAVLGFIPTASFFYPRRLMVSPPEWYFTAIVGDNSIKLLTTSHGYAHYIDEIMSVYRVNVKNSIMTNWRNENHDKEKQVAVTQGFIDLFDAFDVYSNYHYQNELVQAKIPFELNLIKLQGSAKDFNIPRYKEYLDRLHPLEKINYYTGCYFPKLHSTLSRMKARI